MTDLFDNPMGLMGFEFVEFASPKAGVLEPIFESMGFTHVARHRSKNVQLYRQGGINFIVGQRRFTVDGTLQVGAGVDKLDLRSLDLSSNEDVKLVVGATGKLEIDLQPGGQDQIVIDRGGAVLNGELALVRSDDFKPAVGDTIDLLMAEESISGIFSRVTGNSIDFGLADSRDAIGLAVLDVIEDEGLQRNALEMGARLMDGLRRLMEKYPLIGDVRGLGLFCGFELVRDRNSLDPAKEEAGYLVNRMRDHGILLSTDGPFENVIKIKPPLCFSAENADLVLRTLDLVLAEDPLQPTPSKR